MRKQSKQFMRVAIVGLTVISTFGSAFAQSVALPDKDEIAKSSCEQTVRPIQRTKKPAKPATADWTTMASTYSHDQSGQRVDQYAEAVEPQSMERPDFVRSGYRHTRSTLQAGFSADHYHQTETWGQPVRPYGEWRYPNRPFSVPYGQWGPQLPQVVAGGNLWNTNQQFGQGNNMNPGVPGTGVGNPGPTMNWPLPGNGGGGFNGPGAPAWWGQGQGGFGQGPGPGLGFDVGPRNVLPAGQDEYYPQAPIYHPIPDEGFQSPFRNY